MSLEICYVCGNRIDWKAGFYKLDVTHYPTYPDPIRPNLSAFAMCNGCYARFKAGDMDKEYDKED